MGMNVEVSIIYGVEIDFDCGKISRSDIRELEDECIDYFSSIECSAVDIENQKWKAPILHYSGELMSDADVYIALWVKSCEVYRHWDDVDSLKVNSWDMAVIKSRYSRWKNKFEKFLSDKEIYFKGPLGFHVNIGIG